MFVYNTLNNETLLHQKADKDQDVDGKIYQKKPSVNLSNGNFTNILNKVCCNKEVFTAFLYILFAFFTQQNVGKKVALKMLLAI